MLLVFDNFEHLLESADFIGQLLYEAADIKILITSRVRLNLVEEWIWNLQGLAFPDEDSRALGLALLDTPAVCLLLQTQVALFTGEYEAGLEALQECESLLAELDDPHLRSYMLSDFGRLAMNRGELSQAKQYHQETLVLRRSIEHHIGLANTFKDLGQVVQLRGHFRQAEEYFRQSLGIADESNISNREYYAQSLAELAVAEGKFIIAKNIYEKIGKQNEMALVGSPGWAWLGLGEFEDAAQHFAESLRFFLSVGAKPAGLDALVGFAYLYAQAGDVGRSLELLSLVQHHPTCNYAIKQKARTLWDELVAEIDPEIVAAAEAQGQVLDLTTTAEQIVAEAEGLC